jgi:putative ABC transport system ATP-binding protein
MVTTPRALRPTVAGMSTTADTPFPDDGAPSGPVDTAPVPAARSYGATKIYGSGDTAVVALDDVTVEMPTGRFTAVMGPSGSGKSTLMHCMAGLDSLTSGQVFIGDQDLGQLTEDELTLLRRDRIGFVFQAYNLIPEWLATVVKTTGLADRLTHRPSELSGGQQQRVAVARALASRPQIIFADEPTGNLDSRSGTEILEFMRRAVREMAQTIVMVTHDPVAASYADSALFLNDGRIVDRMDEPTAERVLDRLKAFGE